MISSSPDSCSHLSRCRFKGLTIVCGGFEAMLQRWQYTMHKRTLAPQSHCVQRVIYSFRRSKSCLQQRTFGTQLLLTEPFAGRAKRATKSPSLELLRTRVKTYL